jgi:hypothetical protein
MNVELNSKQGREQRGSRWFRFFKRMENDRITKMILKWNAGPTDGWTKNNNDQMTNYCCRAEFLLD